MRMGEHNVKHCKFSLSLRTSLFLPRIFYPPPALITMQGLRCSRSYSSNVFYSHYWNQLRIEIFRHHMSYSQAMPCSEHRSIYSGSAYQAILLFFILKLNLGKVPSWVSTLEWALHLLSSLTRASRFNLSAEDLLSLVISPHGAPVLTGFVFYRAQFQSRV